MRYMDRNEMSTYKVEYREDFNPTKANFITHKKLVLRTNLSKVIKEIMAMYHEKAYKEVANFIPRKIEKIEPLAHVENLAERLYRCKSCLTIYYPEFGDENVNAGVEFEDLKDDYCCSVCGDGKENFEEVNTALLTIK